MERAGCRSFLYLILFRSLRTPIAALSGCVPSHDLCHQARFVQGLIDTGGRQFGASGALPAKPRLVSKWEAFDITTSFALTSGIVLATNIPRDVRYLTGHLPRYLRQSLPTSVCKSFDLRRVSLVCLRSVNVRKNLQTALHSYTLIYWPCGVKDVQLLYQPFVLARVASLRKSHRQGWQRYEIRSSFYVNGM